MRLHDWLVVGGLASVVLGGAMWVGSEWLSGAL
jgi:hypothetical protein